MTTLPHGYRQILYQAMSAAHQLKFTLRLCAQANKSYLLGSSLNRELTTASKA